MFDREMVGREITTARELHGLTPKELASRAGVPAWAVAQAEAGYSLSVERLNLIRSVVGLELLQEASGGGAVGVTGAIASVSSTSHTWAPDGAGEADGRHWVFPMKRKIDPNVDPVEGEFFTPEGLLDALVRESIQNSLDASAHTGPVRVRYALYEGQHALPSATYARYFAGLWPHLAALNEPLPSPPVPLEFIVIEDFGTVGLTGNYLQYSDTGQGPKNHFYYFWRNIGRSSKSDVDRGRWGLGKTVFPAASKINSFFGITIREGEAIPLLMGQSVLKVHSVDGHDYTPYGAFGDIDDEQFVLPITDDPLIQQFCSDFRVRRRDEPGFSVVIPFFRGDEIDLRHLVGATIRHYFYPILNRDLVVELSDGGRHEELNADTLDEIVQRYGDTAQKGETPEQTRKMFDLARWSTTDPAPIELPAPTSNAPNWDKIALEPDLLNDLRGRFERGERMRLCARIPVRLQGKTGPTEAMFDIFIEADPDADRRQRHYIRRGITITNKDAMRTRGARGLVIINDPVLSTLLGDAENPAHTEWNERTPKTKAKYQNAPSTVRFVKNAFDEAIALLSRPPEGMDEDLLADVFSIEIAGEDEAAAASERTSRRKQAPSGVPVISVTPRPRAILVTRTNTGFTVRATGNLPSVGARLTLRVAYEIDGGNSFKRYERFDFELNKPPIWTEMIGVTPGGIDGNEAEFTIESDGFAVTYGGFDANRDLIVQAVVESEASE